MAGGCGWAVPVRGGIGAGGARAAAGTLGTRICASGEFGIPSIVTDVGDVVAAGLTFVEGEGTAPEDAWVVVAGCCDTEASLTALNFFSRATCKSSCKKSSPADCRLRGGFGSFWPEDVEKTGTEAEMCIGV